MRFTDLLSSALANLRQRLFRTALTVLGVVIGAISVVVMISLGIGLTSQFDTQLNSRTLRRVTVDQPPSKAEPGQRQKKMDDKLVKELSELPGVEEVVPSYTITVAARADRNDGTLTIQAVPKEEIEANKFEYQFGGPPTSGSRLSLILGAMIDYNFEYKPGEESPPDIDWEHAQLSLTLPEEYMDERPQLPGSDTSPGEQDTSPNPPKRFSAKVSGQLKDTGWSQEATSAITDLDSMIRILQKLRPGTSLPGQTSERALPGRGNFIYSAIFVYAESAEQAELLVSNLRDKGYSAQADVEVIRQQQNAGFIVQAVLGGIGFVSLLVAAIGIANTMLMSVYERTKEIGVMKVLGAAMKDIRRLFLLESASIGFVGGSIGLLISYLISWGINSLARAGLSADSGVDEAAFQISVIPLPLSLAALLGATLIGTLSGLLPAQRAMRLSALNAIRAQ